MDRNSKVDNVPQWLTKEYIQRVLRKYKNKDSLIIKSSECVQVSGNGNRGEQLPSLMWRINVGYVLDHSHEIIKGSYIVKGTRGTILSSLGTFQREVNFNEKIQEEISRILSNIGDNSQLFPKVVSFDHTNEAIVFQDLVLRGYKNLDRTKRLDLAHAEMVLGKLARMHAASVVLYQSEPEIAETFSVGLLNRGNIEVYKIFLSNLDVLIEEVVKWDKFDNYSRKLQKIRKVFKEKGDAAYRASDSYMNVLIHGDLSMKNFLFKYNSKNVPIDVLLVDLHLSCWSSPAVDLLYLFHTSLQESLRQTK